MGKLIVFGGEKPHLARREMLNIAEVNQSLTKVENIIFVASTSTPISEMPKEEVVKFLGLFFSIMPKDLGIKNPPTTQDVVRIYEYLTKYYGDINPSEMKISFELLLAGELDDYLPKGSDGKADRNHYQQFSLEYLTKVLNAFKRKRTETLHKAIKALPEPEPVASDAEKTFYRNQLYRQMINHFNTYKKTGVFSEDIDAWLYYDVLDKFELAVGTRVTDDERKAALHKLMRKVSTGAINSFVGECIRHQKDSHSLIETQVEVVSRKRALKNSYDKMIFDEIKIEDYLKIE